MLDKEGAGVHVGWNSVGFAPLTEFEDIKGYFLNLKPDLFQLFNNTSGTGRPVLVASQFQTGVFTRNSNF